MSVTTKQPQTAQKLRRIWKVPTTTGRWYWLAASLLFYGVIVAWFYYAAKQQTPDPSIDPFRLFGIIAYVLVLATAAYSLRRRFVRGLPGKVQSWLWMHTWIGIITILIAMLHEDFAFITNSYCTNLSCLTDTYDAGAALFALILLVVSGIIGRLIDLWQTHVIARDANANGVGIVGALEERLLELEYTIERLCAGKSEVFKQFCLQNLGSRAIPTIHSSTIAALPVQERTDFQRACQTLTTRADLARSLHVQKRARLAMRIWRYTHITLACIALLIISYHGIMEVLVNILHLITPTS